MEKKKVAIILQDSNWEGGNNYFFNLIDSCIRLGNSKINLIIFTDRKSKLTKYSKINIKIIRSSIFSRSNPLYWLRFLLSSLRMRDYILYYLLKKNKINVLSHITSRNCLWKNCNIKTLGWISDFQHLHFPEFFTKKNIRFRNRNIIKLIKNSSGIIVSSKSSGKDLDTFFNEKRKNKKFILNFSSALEIKNKIFTKRELISKYSLNNHWFHLPNQFWKHKNQITAIKAFHKIGNKINLILTGVLDDSDQLNTYRNLNNYIKKNKITNIKILKNLPREDVLAIMHHSTAVINTSLFEGWSSTAVEATALKKKMILSRIDVHLEQKQKHTRYFSPLNHEELRNIVLNIHKNQKRQSYKFKNLQIKNEEIKLKFAQKFEKLIYSL
jgi:glycosyltransferase involved in cell wall biosynthesis